MTDGIQVQAIPDSNDVIALKDLYLQIDVSSSVVNMIEDVVTSGENTSATQYVSTSSYLNASIQDKMSEIKRVKIDSILENQIPDFMSEESPLFVEFLRQYYRSLESKSGAIDIAVNLNEYKGISVL